MSNKTFEVLSTFKTKAQFLGVEHHPCRHMTTLCPDRCDHAKDLAKFQIIEWIEFEKKGKYGDEKSEIFYTDAKPKQPVFQQPDEIPSLIAKLESGDTVFLDWEHIYIHDKSSNYPERPVKRIEPVK